MPIIRSGDVDSLDDEVYIEITWLQERVKTIKLGDIEGMESNNSYDSDCF